MAAFETMPQSGDERFGTNDQIRKGQFVRFAKARLEQRFCSGVHEQQPQSLVQHQHGDAQAIHNPAVVVS